MLTCNEFLKSDYYYKNGELDPFLLEHPNCFIRNLYLVVKSMYSGEFNPYNIFFSDITQFIARYDCDKLLFQDIGYRHPRANELLNFPLYQHHGDESSPTELERLLDQGKILIVGTVTEKLPFLNFYNPDYEKDSWVMQHSFLLVGHDRDFYYFVDEPRLLTENYIPHPENQEVGMIEKSFINKIFAEHLAYHTVEINCGDLGETSRNLLPIKASVENYNKGETEIFEDNRDVIINYGRNGLETLINICKKKSGEYIIDNLLEWRDEDLFRMGIGRRQVLKSWMRSYGDCNSKIGAVEDSIQFWTRMRSVLLMKKRRNKYFLDGDMTELFKQALEIEERLISVLESYL